MNALCEVCRHHWYDKTGRRDVSWLFAGARARLGAEGRVLMELDGLEKDCTRLAEHHLCLADGMEPVLDEGDSECGWWEAVA